MAVFMINICKFNGCGLTFPGLGDLIQHIEDTHIDYDPIVVEQKEQAQPSCIPLSYVLRFFTDAARRESINDTHKKIISQSTVGMKCSNSNSSIGSSLQSSTPTGSDMEDEDARSESEDSNDSWTTPEEFSAEFILSLAIKSRVPVVNNKKNNAVGWIATNTKDNNNVDKPFACPVPGCKKRYKNVNGIKYHSKNGHKKDGKVRKGFKCHCGKSYKTAQGLKTHTTAYHNGANLTTITTPTGEILQIPTSQVTTIQPLRTLTVKQISASSLSSLGLPVKSIQSVVVTTKSASELLNKNYDIDNNKTTTLRVLKDISLPIVKNNSSLHLSSTALQSLVTNAKVTESKESNNNSSISNSSNSGNNNNNNNNNNSSGTNSSNNNNCSSGNCNQEEVIEVTDNNSHNAEILAEIENVSDFLNSEMLNDQTSLMEVEEIKEATSGADSDKGKTFKIKMQPEKEKLIKLMTNEDAEKIQVGHVQIKLPDPKVKLTTIKPTSIKLSSPQVLTSLRNRLDSINKHGRIPVQENLGILTPAASPLMSPESKSLTYQSKSPGSPPSLPLTPVSPIHMGKLTGQIKTSDPRESEKMEVTESCTEQVALHPDT
ncbi:hypothetical protein RUM44_006185 [Polyplax serrata]|uniref:C2H2-type domain-containing protein n=1 Tax=Polyplax serrata TaxID=468196 RepID=A0ABR1AZ79_POLSC